MKANEFRIGNYISSSEDGVFQIEELCKLSKESANQNIGARYRQGSFWTDCESIIPVPLEDYWFIKFGFNKHESKNFASSIIVTKPIAKHGLKKLALYNYPSIGWSTCLVDYYTGKELTETLPRDIKYVHELQNLYYSLTGLELHMGGQAL